MVIFWSFDKGFDWRSCRISKSNQTDCCYLIASVIVLYRVRQGFYLQFLFIAFIGKNRNFAFFIISDLLLRILVVWKYSLLSLKSGFYYIEILCLLINFGSFTYKKTVSIFGWIFLWIFVCIIESFWFKIPLRSWSPVNSLTLPRASLNHFPKCHIYMIFGHLQASSSHTLSDSGILCHIPAHPYAESHVRFHVRSFSGMSSNCVGFWLVFQCTNSRLLDSFLIYKLIK